MEGSLDMMGMLMGAEDPYTTKSKSPISKKVTTANKSVQQRHANYTIQISKNNNDNITL